MTVLNDYKRCGPWSVVCGPLLLHKILSGIIAVPFPSFLRF